MSVTKREYKMLVDFPKVYAFLEEIYNTETYNSYLLPQYFEYAHMHPWFKIEKSWRSGVWEEEGKVVAVVMMDMSVGECALATARGYEYLLSEMLAHAEEYLYEIKDGKRTLCVWITDKEEEKKNLLLQNGYKFKFNDPVKTFFFDKPFVDYKLPEGYKVIDGTEVDYPKMHVCLWKGFDHGDDVPEDYEGRIFGCKAPHNDMRYTSIVVAPNGDYACFAGMWVDKRNNYAYLEPLATPPEYRRKGMATAALMHAMAKTKADGAQYCFCGANDFYTAIGCEVAVTRQLYSKEWDV